MNAPPPELGADLVGLFAWDVQADAWTWSAEAYRLHGYRPDEVVVTADLLLGHKVGAGRRRAERVIAHVDTPGFRFGNHHRIVDAQGRERLVVSVGTAVREATDDGSRLVLRGYLVDISDHQGRALDAALHHSADLAVDLSAREREVLLLVATGSTNQEVADTLYVSLNTVKTYLRTAYRKIGVSRRSQAVLWAVANRDLLAGRDA